MITQSFVMLCDYDLCKQKVTFTLPITPEEIDKTLEKQGFTVVEFPDGSEDHLCREHSNNTERSSNV